MTANHLLNSTDSRQAVLARFSRTCLPTAEGGAAGEQQAFIRAYFGTAYIADNSRDPRYYNNQNLDAFGVAGTHGRE